LRAALALTAVVLALPVPLAAQDVAPAEPTYHEVRSGDLVSVFSGDVHVPADVRHRGTVVCIGGTARIEGEVSEDVVVILGSLELTGEVGGAVTGVLSDMELRGADVEGEMVSVLSSLELERSTVRREFVNVLGSLSSDDLSELRHELVNIGLGGDWLPDFWTLLFWLRVFHKFLVFVLLVLFVLLLPDRVRRMGEEAPVRYLPAFFVGLLTYLALLVVVPLLAVTVVGLVAGAAVFYVLKWLGIAAIFYAIGRRLGRSVGVSLSVPGAVLAVFLAYGVVLTVPALFGLVGYALVAVLHLVFFLLVEAPAVGLVLLTRFGNARPAAAPAPPPPAEPGPAPHPAVPSAAD
jgi:hypothetical protein